MVHRISSSGKLAPRFTRESFLPALALQKQMQTFAFGSARLVVERIPGMGEGGGSSLPWSTELAHLVNLPLVSLGKVSSQRLPCKSKCRHSLLARLAW